MTTYQAAYAKFLPLARQLPGDSIREFRADVRLPLVNIRLGVQAALGTTDQVNQVKLVEGPQDDCVQTPSRTLQTNLHSSPQQCKLFVPPARSAQNVIKNRHEIRLWNKRHAHCSCASR